MHGLWNNGAHVEALYKHCASLPPGPPAAAPPAQVAARMPWRRIDLEDVAFEYAGAQRNVLHRVTLAIEAGRSYGIVGRSGAGKSTLIDLVVGLLSPTSGRILVDGKPLTAEAAPRWQQRIGYVPQSPFILDDTLRANIALGIPPHEVDEARLRRCLDMANLTELASELHAGLEAPLGDRGIRLSGGQRQRVAIARALYKDPDILVLDEATSALDSPNERLVYRAIDSLKGRLTIISIAHRITTLQGCDEILVMEGGRLAARGTHKELLRSSRLFAELAAAEPAPMSDAANEQKHLEDARP
jgi:ATP-binding cassette subfamily C protein